MFEVFKYIGVPVEEINYNQPKKRSLYHRKSLELGVLYMDILQITEKQFSEFGRIVQYDGCLEIVQALEKYTPLPDGVEYVPEESALQNLEATNTIATSLYGGMPVQFGWCNGHNTKLNCLEYHRDSEFNIGTEDFILLLAKQSDIRENKNK